MPSFLVVAASDIFPVFLQASDSPMALAGRSPEKYRGSSRSPGDTLGSSPGVNDEFDTKWRGKGLGKLLTNLEAS